MSDVLAILDHYLDGGDFENARDALHALGPTAMSEVLAVATTHPAPRGLELLVMVLADKSYPPALGAFRRWLDHPDLENIAYPAATALAKYADEQFDTEDLYDLSVPAAKRLLREIAAWWDAGGHHIPTEAEWFAQQAAEQTRDAAPIDRARVIDPLTPAELDAFRPQIIALKQSFERLPGATQHRLDAASIKRVLPIYAGFAPDDRVLDDALAALDQFLAGGPAPMIWEKPVGNATRAANAAAEWSATKDTLHLYAQIVGKVRLATTPPRNHWRFPMAKAAGHVAQGVLYALSPELRNRLQAMHNARDALHLAGRGFAAVWAELEWQLAQVRGASS